MNEEPHVRLRNLRKSKGFTKPEEAAQRYGWNVHTYKAHEAGARGMKQDSLKIYAKAFSSTPEYIQYGSTKVSAETLREPVGDKIQNKSIPHDAPVPIYGILPGHNRLYIREENIVGYMDQRPTELQKIKGGYIVYVTDNLMEPRYRAGEKASVNPYIPPTVGQDCLVIMKTGEAVVRCYMGEEGTDYKFLQYHPSGTLPVPKGLVEKLLAVVGRPS